ncbi:hypothetical protein M8C21_003355 [Ambrosia artemisiifolia]|uniref:Uncharacterized protein n=1 Tax=Ambrosia artemisiifolia TaxID=4212 RepID=A0AAD5GS84_AMBAR|nr:hypothetical protein M8C21_003355 [Ambrosia artemisiifolia]
MGNNVVLMLISFLLIISSSSGDDSPDFRDALGRQSFLPPKNTNSPTPITPSGPSESTGDGSPPNFESNMMGFAENMTRFAENMSRYAENRKGMRRNYMITPPPPDPSIQDYDTEVTTEQPPPER